MMNSNRLSYKDEIAIRRKKKPKTGREGAHLFPASTYRQQAVATIRTPYSQWKRAADVVLASLLFVPSLPLMLVAFLLVRLTSRGPGIYVQHRLGAGGLPFRIF